MLRLLFLGDIVGEPGRKAVIDALPWFKKERGVDFIVANGENSAGGRGISPKISVDCFGQAWRSSPQAIMCGIRKT